MFFIMRKCKKGLNTYNLIFGKKESGSWIYFTETKAVFMLIVLVFWTQNEISPEL